MATTSGVATGPMSHRTALVTGAGRPQGIGRACVRGLLQAGYKVMAWDVVGCEDNDPILTKYADRLHFQAVDVCSRSSIHAALEAGQQHFGSDLHCIVNNAAIADPYLKDEKREAQWQRVIATNLTGPFFVSEAALPHMVEKDSSIIHISSTRAHQSEPNSEAYASAKAGLLGLTHAQAVTLAHKVRVNVILPGWINTFQPEEELTLEDHMWHPAGRVGRPEDVAELVLFLADSSKSGFITGQEFVVDGGVSKKMIYPE